MEQEKYKYMVRVSCITYNHAAYIEKALDGFCMQETSFPFVCTIVDDASIDGEQEVLRQYIQEHFNLDDSSVYRNEETEDFFLVFAQHNTNKNCYFAVFLLKYNHRSIKKPKKNYLKEWNDSSKYIARCEGDDYWIYNLKLEEQVAFMESNPDFSLCFGDVKYYHIDKHVSKGNISIISGNDNRQLEKYDGEQLFFRVLMGKAHIQTLTVLYRSALVGHIKKNTKGFAMGDTPLWLDLSQQGKIKYIEKVYGVYNVHYGSASHNPETKFDFALSMYEMRCYYCEKYGYSIPKQLKKKYNTVFKDRIALSGEIMPLPFYGLFKLNPIQYRIDSLVTKNDFIKALYKKIFPVIRLKRNFFSKMNLIKKSLVNFFLSKSEKK